MFVSLLWLLFLFGHEASTSPAALNEAIDLTHAVDAGLTLQWPSASPFTFKIVVRGQVDKVYYESNDFGGSEHAGTHLDAPAHFSEGKWRVGDIPWERLAGPAVVVDITEKAKSDSDAQLTVSDLESHEASHGRIPDGAVVLMNSGHGRFYGNKTRYFGYPPGVMEKNPKDTENLHFPGIHPQAAEWLAKERSIIGVGVDTPSTDFGQSKDFQTHQILASANIWGLENVAHLDHLPPRGFTVFAMVLKLRQGSGGPARVFAMPTQQQVSSNGAAGAINASGLATCLMITHFAARKM